MKKPEWIYNGQNGETDGFMFRSWGLGVHRITATPKEDVIFPNTEMFGHAGDAYGLISDLYNDPNTGFGFIFITNGFGPGHAY